MQKRESDTESVNGAPNTIVCILWDGINLLLDCVFHSQSFAFSTAEFLDHFWQRFIAEVDATAIVLELEHRHIISNGDRNTVSQNMDATQQAQLLHACLKKTCDMKALTDVCDIIAKVNGNPKMKSLGEDMKTELGKRCVWLQCVCVHVLVMSE